MPVLVVTAWAVVVALGSALAFKTKMKADLG